MARSGLLVKRPLPKASSLAAKIRNRIRENVSPVGKEIANGHNNIVRGWQSKNKPQFASRVTFSKSGVAIGLIILNANSNISNGTLTVNQLFNMWEFTGSRPHQIRPRGEGYPLRFQIEGQWIHTYLVNHPGTIPQHKTDDIFKKAEPKIGPLIKKSIREGMS